MNISKTFCVLPFTHLNIKQKGKISACWRYPGKIGDYSKQTLQEIWNDTEIKKIRKALLNDERYHGCKSCWDMEDSGIVSTRQQHTAFPQRNQQDIESIIADDYTMPISELQHIEIRFDNICNLMCRHCSSDYSSKWHAAVQQDARVPPGRHSRPPTHPQPGSSRRAPAARATSVARRERSALRVAA